MPRGLSRSKRQLQRNAAVAACVAKGLRPPPGWVPDHLPVRGLLVCAHPACPERESSFVDRDVNAPLSVGRAFVALDMGGDIPAYMRRGSHKVEDAADLGLWRGLPFTLRPLAPVPPPHGDGHDVHLRRVQAAAAPPWRPPWPDPAARPSAQQRRLERRAAERAGRAGGVAADATPASSGDAHNSAPSGAPATAGLRGGISCAPWPAAAERGASTLDGDAQ